MTVYSDVLRYRELLGNLFRRDLQAKYRGSALGVLWTPCAGPVLGSILTLIATSENLGRAALLLVTYAAGAGIPILLIVYGGQYATTQVRKLAPYTPALRRSLAKAATSRWNVLSRAFSAITPPSRRRAIAIAPSVKSASSGM